MAGDEDHKQSARPLMPSARTSTRLGLGEVDVIAPGVLHFRFAGKITLGQAQIIVRAGNESITRGDKPLIAIDASDVHAYESDVRRLIQSWLKRNRTQIAGCWMLFRSPVVKMGINLINSVLDGAIRPFDDYEEFDRELARARVQAERRAAIAPRL